MSTRRHLAASNETTRPRPLEIVAAKIAVHIDHLTGEVQTGSDIRLQGMRIDFIGTDPTDSDLGIVEISWPGNSNRQGGYERSQFPALPLGHPCHECRRLETCPGEQDASHLGMEQPRQT